MGIKGLSQVIKENAAESRKENEIKNYFGRKIAVDASTNLYQFLVAVRAEGANLMNDEGETTSHLSGFFFRTIRLINHGIKPVYIFDGKPPSMKSKELAKRTERREAAAADLEKAQAEGNTEDMDKFSRRLVKVTKKHAEDCKTLLSLMGVPYMTAPGEAEAQCAELAKMNKVYAVATEDMDALTFGSTILLRNMFIPEFKKEPILEYHLDKVLAGLGLSMDQFIDMCILLGCDYCDKIEGIGAVRAPDLIKKYGSIEGILKQNDKKHKVPENWEYEAAKELFVKPDVEKNEEVIDSLLKWGAPKEEELVEFMCKQNGFQEQRIRSGIEKLKKARSGPTQNRLDSFFKVLPQSGSIKREADSKDSKSKKSKAGANGKGAKKGSGGKPRR